MEQTQRPKPLAFVLIRRGPGSGQIHTITRDRTTIGRLKKNTIIILDQEVSREHAVISRIGEQFFIKDAGSTNGTALNEKPITGSALLKHGDTITLGPNILLTFLCELPDQQKQPSVLVRYLPILLPLLVVLLFTLLISFALSLEPQPSRTTAQILSPSPGTVFPKGEENTILVAAFSDLTITRVELWIDGDLNEQHTDLEGETAPVYLRTNRVFSSLGQHTLLVRVFDSAGNRSSTRLAFTVGDPVDKDGDRVPDENDRCPDSAGSAAAEGCPDADLDTIADDRDVCPQTAGLFPGAGCPVVSENDQDGDGQLDADDNCPEAPGPAMTAGCPDTDGDLTADDFDACPDVYGAMLLSGCILEDNRDGDLLPDSEDLCPTEAGELALSGCPDQDSDGLEDSIDLCPTQAGEADLDGCRDRDGDSLADIQDLCPNTAGSSESAGCPPGDTIDSDADTVPDFLDLCPQEEGDVEQAGCSPPGTAPDTDKNGIADDQQLLTSLPASSLLASWLINVPDDLVVLELEILQVQAAGNISSISCEVRINEPFSSIQLLNFELADAPEPAGQIQHFTPAGRTAPVLTLFARKSEALQIQINCSTIREEKLVSLGDIKRTLSPADWDGEKIQSMSSPYNGEEPLVLEYRVCEGGCAAAGGLPLPPLTSLYTTGSHNWLFWEDLPGQSLLDHYNLYLNGTQSWSIPAGTNGLQLDITPPCDQNWDLYLTGMQGIHESLAGNRITLQGERCPQAVRVRFTGIKLLEDFEGFEEDGTVGPVRGIFYAASSADYQQLSWSSASTNEALSGSEACSTNGLNLTSDSTEFEQIFSWIHGQENGSNGDENTGTPLSGQYYAPLLPELTLSLEPGQALTIGARVEDLDCPGGHHDILLEVSESYDTLPEEPVELDGGGAVLMVEFDRLTEPGD
ncbi:MAG: FHA domain-containing protein [Anaerolineales bacterium]|nr:FHA domain-containing protein [Anaerolineales bacterium]